MNKTEREAFIKSLPDAKPSQKIQQDVSDRLAFINSLPDAKPKMPSGLKNFNPNLKSEDVFFGGKKPTSNTSKPLAHGVVHGGTELADLYPALANLGIIGSNRFLGTDLPFWGYPSDLPKEAMAKAGILEARPEYHGMDKVAYEAGRFGGGLGPASAMGTGFKGLAKYLARKVPHVPYASRTAHSLGKGLEHMQGTLPGSPKEFFRQAGRASLIGGGTGALEEYGGLEPIASALTAGSISAMPALAKYGVKKTLSPLSKQEELVGEYLRNNINPTELPNVLDRLRGEVPQTRQTWNPATKQMQDVPVLSTADIAQDPFLSAVELANQTAVGPQKQGFNKYRKDVREQMTHPEVEGIKPIKGQVQSAFDAEKQVAQQKAEPLRKASESLKQQHARDIESLTPAQKDISELGEDIRKQVLENHAKHSQQRAKVSEPIWSEIGTGETGQKMAKPKNSISIVEKGIEAANLKADDKAKKAYEGAYNAFLKPKTSESKALASKIGKLEQQISDAKKVGPFGETDINKPKLKALEEELDNLKYQQSDVKVAQLVEARKGLNEWIGDESDRATKRIYQKIKNGIEEDLFSHPSKDVYEKTKHAKESYTELSKPLNELENNPNTKAIMKRMYQDFTVKGSEIPSKFFRSKDKSLDQARFIKKQMAGNTELNNNVKHWAANEALSATIKEGKDGMRYIDRPTVKKWVKDNPWAKEFYPDLVSQLEKSSGDITKSKWLDKKYQDVVKQNDKNLDIWQKEVGKEWFGAETDSIMKSVLNNPKPGARAQQLDKVIDIANQDKTGEAMKSLQNGTIDYLFGPKEPVNVKGVVLDSKSSQLRTADKALKLMDSNKENLKKVFGDNLKPIEDITEIWARKSHKNELGGTFNSTTGQNRNLMKEIENIGVGKGGYKTFLAKKIAGIAGLKVDPTGMLAYGAVNEIGRGVEAIHLALQEGNKAIIRRVAQDPKYTVVLLTTPETAAEKSRYIEALKDIGRTSGLMLRHPKGEKN